MISKEGVMVRGHRVGIGEIAVLVVFGLFVGSWALMLRFPWAEVPRAIFMAGFIGGFTDTVAIRMLFEHKWYLPGSGVLLKERDAIIATLADTMEEHILNPALIEGKVHELARNLDRDRIAAGANDVIDEIRPDLIAYVSAPEQRAQIIAALRREGGFWGAMADSIGLVTYDVLTDRLVDGIAQQINAFRVDAAMVDKALAKVGSVDDLVLKPGNPLIARHYGADRSLAQILFEKLDAKQLVIDKLSAYDATKIRDIVADNVADHLGWLQVFGCLLGMLIATLMLLVQWLF
jgi:uncharacterized membrane-anchored protein YjiN (DUF445 family)